MLVIFPSQARGVRTSDNKTESHRTSPASRFHRDETLRWAALICASADSELSCTARSPSDDRAGQDSRVQIPEAGIWNSANAPAVARASYVDPLVIEMYQHGETAQVPASARRGGLGAEATVQRLLSG
jgi:hypothetical protein